MLILAAAPVCLSPTIVTIVALCALATGCALGAFVGAIVTGEILTMRARRADPYARPFGDQPNLMRAFNGGRG